MAGIVPKTPHLTDVTALSSEDSDAPCVGARARFLGEPEGGGNAGTVPNGPRATAFTSPVWVFGRIVKAAGRVRLFGERGGGIGGTSANATLILMFSESLSSET